MTKMHSYNNVLFFICVTRQDSTAVGLYQKDIISPRWAIMGQYGRVLEYRVLAADHGANGQKPDYTTIVGFLCIGGIGLGYYSMYSPLYHHHKRMVFV